MQPSIPREVFAKYIAIIFIEYLATRTALTELTNPCFIFTDDIKAARRDISRDLEAVKRWSACRNLLLNGARCQLLATKVD